LGIGDWGLGIGDWGLGIGVWGPRPQPQKPKPKTHFSIFCQILFLIAVKIFINF